MMTENLYDKPMADVRRINRDGVRRQIGRLGSDDYAIATMARGYGVAVGTFRRLVRDILQEDAMPKVNYDRMQELHDDGYSDSQIAYELGCSSTLVYQWRKKHGLTGNKRKDINATASSAPSKADDAVKADNLIPDAQTLLKATPGPISLMPMPETLKI